MTKKNRLVVLSGLLSAVLYILNFVGTYWVCDHFFVGGHAGNCPTILSDGMIILFPVIPLFIVSLVVHFLRDDVFQVWIKFVYVWLPLTMFAILIAPEYGNALLPVEKGTVGVFFSLLFVIISIVLIFVKYFRLRR